jgi:spore maturation protein CgeB
MNFCLFYHSLVSDWNHGNAHFLRGVVSELLARGHDVRVFEPRDGWSRRNLMEEYPYALDDFRRAFPLLTSELYDTDTLDVDATLAHADVVIIHEWTDPPVRSAIANHRTRQGKYCLLLHDTHHRAVSDPDALNSMAIEPFDGVLAFGASLAEQYRIRGWGRRVWVWHEAADTRVFRPAMTESGAYPPLTPSTQVTNNPGIPKQQAPSSDARGDLVWVGNWGDNERAQEINQYLIEPVRRLQLRARVHGVRYPAAALDQLQSVGIDYAGWIPNYRVPDLFAQFRATVHIPRGPYVSMLPGIPTIRMFEALACGIPLVSAPWDDCEELFRPGDFVMVHDTDEMSAGLARVLRDPDYAAQLATRGLDTIRARHTCAHRVDELFSILASIGAVAPVPVTSSEGV